MDTGCVQMSDNKRFTWYEWLLFGFGWLNGFWSIAFWIYLSFINNSSPDDEKSFFNNKTNRGIVNYGIFALCYTIAIISVILFGYYGLASLIIIFGFVMYGKDIMNFFTSN